MSTGLELIPCDEYEYDRWRPKRFALEVLDGASPGAVRVATSFVRSKGTPPDGVVGPLVQDGPGVSAAGAVLLIDKAMTGPLWVGPWPDLQQFADRGAKAVVFAVSKSFDELQGNWSPHTGPYQPIPALVVDRDAGAALRAQAAARPTVRLTLEAPLKKTLVRSVTAVLPGRSDEVVIVDTHTDGQNFVEENGCMALVQLARHFASLPRAQAARPDPRLRGVAGPHGRHVAAGARMDRGAPRHRQAGGRGRDDRAPRRDRMGRHPGQGLPRHRQERALRALDDPRTSDEARQAGGPQAQPPGPRRGRRARHLGRLGVPQDGRPARRRNRRADLPAGRVEERRDGQARRAPCSQTDRLLRRRHPRPRPRGRRRAARRGPIARKRAPTRRATGARSSNAARPAASSWTPEMADGSPCAYTAACGATARCSSPSRPSMAPSQMSRWSSAAARASTRARRRSTPTARYGACCCDGTGTSAFREATTSSSSGAAAGCWNGAT